MQLDQYSLFFIITILAAGFSAYLAASVSKLRPSPGVVPFSWLMALIAVWNGSVAAGMLSGSQQTAHLWIIVRMFAVILTPIAWLSFVADYTGREGLIRSRTALLIFLVPILSVALLLTNGGHHLFYGEIEFARSGQFLVDESWQLGPYFYFHLVYSYGMVILADFLLLIEAFRVSKQHRQQSLALILATLIPAIIDLTSVLDIFPALKVSYDPLGFVIAGLILSWAIYFNQLFDLSPIARGILVDNMIDGMIVVNQQNRIVDLNPAAESIFDIGKYLIGTDLDDLFEQLRLEPLHPGDQDERYHIKLDDDDGIRRFYDIQSSPIVVGRMVRGTLLTIRDITSQKRIEDQLQYLAITDSLTGLANHRHFYELLNNELERSKRSYEPFSVIMLDIDHFKRINDKHGHLIGDQVLREISIICMKALRQYDILCRYGGEEFSVILPETDIRSAKATAERLRNVVESNTFFIAETEFKLTISLGVSCYDPYNPVAAKELVGQADRRLYFSKENGRNQVTISDPEPAV